MQLDEGDTVAVSGEAQDQILDAAKRANPANDIWIYESGRIKFDKGEGTCVASKRVGGIWKGLFPQFDGAFWGTESDVSEKVLSSPRNPRFEDDAECLERSRFILQVIDD